MAAQTWDTSTDAQFYLYRDFQDAGIDLGTIHSWPDIEIPTDHVVLQASAYVEGAGAHTGGPGLMYFRAHRDAANVNYETIRPFNRNGVDTSVAGIDATTLDASAGSTAWYKLVFGGSDDVGSVAWPMGIGALGISYADNGGTSGTLTRLSVWLCIHDINQGWSVAGL